MCISQPSKVDSVPIAAPGKEETKLKKDTVLTDSDSSAIAVQRDTAILGGK